MSGTAAAAWGWCALFSAVTALVAFSAAFVVGNAINRHRIVDAVWGPAFALVALVAFVSSSGHGDPGRRALALGLTVVWGLRLGVHIGWRGRGKDEDPRYAKLLSRGGHHRAFYAFTHIYLLQGALVWFISLPVQVAAFGTAPPGPVAAIGGVLWLIGFFFEAVGDWQLERFKADPAHRGALMDQGLWRYTRHPNYFGDACVWWGLFLLAADQWAGLATVLSPVVMTLFLTIGSGMRMTDRRMAETRPAYAAYAARTSGFVPRPPRRAAKT
jgi:steroid 5-alpha reductase family enzyme